MAYDLVELLKFSDERALEMELKLKTDNLLRALETRATLPADPQSVLGWRRRVLLGLPARRKLTQRLRLCNVRESSRTFLDGAMSLACKPRPILLRAKGSHPIGAPRVVSVPDDRLKIWCERQEHIGSC